MATSTPNLNLILPDYSDKADISVLNDNFQKIDEYCAKGGVSDEELQNAVKAANAWANATVSAESVSADNEADVNLTEGDNSKNLHFSIPRGQPGVLISETEPTDPNVKVWIKPDGEPNELEQLKSDVSSLKDTKADVIIDTTARAASHELHAQSGEMAVTLYGKTTETGSGVDAARVHCGGKNLCQLIDNEKDVLGVAAKLNADGSVSMNGTSTGNPTYYFDLMYGIKIQNGLKLSLSNNSGEWIAFTIGEYVNGVKKLITTRNYTGGASEVVDMSAYAGRTIGYIGVYIGTGRTYNGNVYAMFGYDLPTAYEPYNANVINLPLLPDGAPLMDGETIENWALVDGERKIRVKRLRNDTVEVYYGDPVGLRKPDTLTTDTVTVTGSAETDVEYYCDTKTYIDKIRRSADESRFKPAEYMPVLELTGDPTGMSKDVAVELDYKFNGLIGKCTVKWQGSSSLAWPKKNYTIKFDNAFEAKEGWGAEKKYCAKANYIDFSHARNVCCAKLWGQIVKSRNNPPENISSLVNGGAIDGFPIGITLNGENMGLFTFNIPKDGWMYGMGDGDREAILCAHAHVTATNFREPATLDGDFDLEYVSDENDSDWVLTSLNTLINSVIGATSSNLDTTVAQYLDWDSAIDYYIFTCLVQGHDMTDKNYLLYTFDGVKWGFGAYDMDSTFGLYWNGTFFYPAGHQPTFDFYANINRVMALIKTVKTDVLKERYAQLRKTVLSEANLAATFSNFTASIPKRCFDEEVKLWPRIPSTAANNLHQILDYYRMRVAIMDEEIAAL